MKTLLLVGTKKGLFLFDSADRKKWNMSGPHQAGREINHAVHDPRNGCIFATANDAWFGCEIVSSPDLGKNWSGAKENPKFPESTGQKLERIWHIEPGRAAEPDVLFAGVAPASLFRSEDEGATWSEVIGLTSHPTRPKWHPGAGGLCLHSIAVDHVQPGRMFVGISAVGVFAPRTTAQPGKRPTRAPAPIFCRKSSPNTANASISSCSPRARSRCYSSRIIAAFIAAGIWAVIGTKSRPACRAILAFPWRCIRAMPILFMSCRCKGRNFAVRRREYPRLPQPRRRQFLGSPQPRTAAGKCLCRHLPRRHGVRQERPGGNLFWHQHGEGLCLQRRRRFVVLAGRQSVRRSFPCPPG